MKRFLAATLVLSMFSACTLVGCSEESKETKKDTVSTPSGTKDVETTTKVKASGDEKPSAETPK